MNHFTKLYFFVCLHNYFGCFTVVSGSLSNCEGVVMREYKYEFTSKRNFLFSLKMFNDNYFINLIPSNTRAHEYFHFLIHVLVLPEELTIWTPREYCVRFYGEEDLFCLAAMQLLEFHVDTPGRKALEHVYLNHIYSNIAHILNDANNPAIKIIQGYFIYLFNKTAKLDDSHFPDIKEFCNFINN